MAKAFHRPQAISEDIRNRRLAKIAQKGADGSGDDIVELFRASGVKIIDRRGAAS